LGEEKGKRESKRESVAVKSNETKANPIHFNKVDGVGFPICESAISA
jgi:hypothetical protein